MAGLGSIKIIKRPPPAKAQFAAIQESIKKELAKVGQQHIREREKIVGNFDTEIKFGYRISITQAQVTLTVLLENESTQVSEGFSAGDLWKALDKTGVRPHIIRPKKPGGVLAFQAGYQPHTRPIARSGGPGRASGPIVTTRFVNHPGFPPRHFSREIGKRLERQYKQAIDRGVRLGSKKR